MSVERRLPHHHHLLSPKAKFLKGDPENPFIGLLITHVSGDHLASKNSSIPAPRRISLTSFSVATVALQITASLYLDFNSRKTSRAWGEVLHSYRRLKYKEK